MKNTSVRPYSYNRLDEDSAYAIRESGRPSSCHANIPVPVPAPACSFPAAVCRGRPTRARIAAPLAPQGAVGRPPSRSPPDLPDSGEQSVRPDCAPRRRSRPWPDASRPGRGRPRGRRGSRQSAVRCRKRAQARAGRPGGGRTPGRLRGRSLPLHSTVLVRGEMQMRVAPPPVGYRYCEEDTLTHAW